MATQQPILNLFATVLTHAAPSSNYRGESEQNRTVLQKIERANGKYAIVSADSIRNALRETVAKFDFPCNRERVYDADQLAVSFEDYPNPDLYIDDWAFGYLVAKREDADKMQHPAKRDSVIRLNLAVALEKYRFDASLHQSPMSVDNKSRTKVFWLNSKQSALLHRETSYTAFQYPFALAGRDCLAKPDWTKALLRGIAELNDVAGGHARNYFEFAPKSIAVRLTPKLVAGFETYGFDATGHWGPIARLNADDLPPEEFWLGGELVRNLSPEQAQTLEAAGAKLFANPDRLLTAVADAFLGGQSRAAA